MPKKHSMEPRRVSLAGLVTCAGVLTATLPAEAQSEAPPAPESSLEASPPAPEGSPTASPPAAEGSPAAEPGPEDPPEVQEGELAEVVVTGFRRSLSVALARKQRATGQVDAIGRHR